MSVVARKRTNAKKNVAGKKRRNYAKRPYRRIGGKGAYLELAPVSGGHVSDFAHAGGLIGSGLGVIGGKLANYFTGQGEYKVNSNVFSMDGKLPSMHDMSKNGVTNIRFQEYLGDIITSSVVGEFKNQTFTVNAGNSLTFPYLSQIACNYEQYRIRGMVFAFKSTSADALNSVNTALGSVMMASQYDSLETPFESKVDMLNYEYSSCGKPSEDILHMIECAPRQTTIPLLYTLYDQETPVGGDPRLYNLCRLNIATVGFQGSAVRIGQLHVTYDIDLLKPKLFTTLGRSNIYMAYVNGNGTAGVYTDPLPFGLNQSAIDLILDSPTLRTNTRDIIITPTSFVLPATSIKRCWRIEVKWFGSVAAAVVYPTVTASNSLVTSIATAPDAGANVNSCCLLLGIQQLGNDLPADIQFGAVGTLPAGNQQIIIRFMEAPDSFGGQ